MPAPGPDARLRPRRHAVRRRNTISSPSRSVRTSSSTRAVHPVPPLRPVPARDRPAPADQRDVPGTGFVHRHGAGPDARLELLREHGGDMSRRSAHGRENTTASAPARGSTSASRQSAPRIAPADAASTRTSGTRQRSFGSRPGRTPSSTRWLCDEGRFSVRPDGPAPPRLTTPLVRITGRLMPVSWDRALELATSAFRKIAQAPGPSGRDCRRHRRSVNDE